MTTEPPRGSPRSEPPEPEVQPGPPSEGAAEPGPDEATAGQSFFIVGVGASAGGLEALAGLVRSLPRDHAAFVIIQHLAPDHESLLPELLARKTNLPVLTAQDLKRVEANHIYVIPPNADLELEDGILRVRKPAPGRLRLPVDHFFRSLALDQGARSIGVVLSGTGSDGTLGLQAIKAAGGVTFVQDPSSARYDGMPNSALHSGAADFCLDPEGIAHELLRISAHPYLNVLKRGAGMEGQLGQLFSILRGTANHDLSQYKVGTIERRTERRMALARVERLGDYIALLKSNREEARRLYKDLLIGVTSFFRDAAPFDELKARVFPRLLEDRSPNKPVRVWVPGCSTGEEVYSIAIALLEFLGDNARDRKVQLFGTDVDASAIDQARRGAYPQNIELDVSPERLARFFVKRDGGFQVTRAVRDLVVFSTQNVVRDAPFSRVDLVSCRNLLIYLQAPLQKRLLRFLHYALNPTGFLLLGTSETVGDSAELFALVDRKNKIYAKKQMALGVLAQDATFSSLLPRPQTATQVVTPRPAINLMNLVDRRILDLYGPPGVVVNENFEILQFRGRTGAFLEPAPGAATLNVLRLARPELHLELHRVLHRALDDDATQEAHVQLVNAATREAVTIQVMPVIEPETRTRCLLVLFRTDAPLPVAPGSEAGASGPGADVRVRELERELSMLKEYLQTTTEELESANQELKSSNEELQSANEELQSTNEELETSKEELQSANEELTTVNDELQERMSELSQTNDDLHNVLTGTDHPIVIVGKDLRIRRFTAAAARVLHLALLDVGRSAAHLDVFAGGRRLSELIGDTVVTAATHAEELRAADGRWYSVHVAPYLTQERQVSGAVVTIADVHVRKSAEELVENVQGYADRFLKVVQHPLLILDEQQRVVWVNEPWLSFFRLAPEEVVGRALQTVGGTHWADDRLWIALAKTLGTGEPFRDLRLSRDFPEVGQRMLRIAGSRIPPLAEEAQLVLVSIEEILAAKG
jgi:two-component system CheB/CheR fusion protein